MDSKKELGYQKKTICNIFTNCITLLRNKNKLITKCVLIYILAIVINTD